MTTEPARDALAEALREALTEATTLLDPVVDGVRRLSSGASRETWSFTVTADGTATDMIMQRSRTADSPTALHGPTEAALVEAAGAAGTPVATVVAAGTGADPLERPWVITERRAGEAIPRKLLRDDRFAAVRPGLTAQFAGALASIHTVDPDALPDLPTVDQLRFWERLWADLDDPHPVFDFAIGWLHDHGPPEGRRAVVHGDFRTGNLLVDEERGLTAVLDWELAHVGDPVEDLGWLCVRAWRFGSRLPAGGFGTRAELLAAYRAAGGDDVSPDRLHWWEVFGTLRWGIICRLQTSGHLLGLHPSIELATIGRRVAETEYDLLLLLAPVALHDVDPVDELRLAPPEERGVHDRPAAPELLDAVATFLDTDVRPVVDDPRVSYLLRVAANAVGIAQRETALAPLLDARHHARLDALGVGSDSELSARIAEGSLDPDAIVAALAEATLDKLYVANPNYPE